MKMSPYHLLSNAHTHTNFCVKVLSFAAKSNYSMKCDVSTIYFSYWNSANMFMTIEMSDVFILSFSVEVIAYFFSLLSFGCLWNVCQANANTLHVLVDVYTSVSNILCRNYSWKIHPHTLHALSYSQARHSSTNSIHPLDEEITIDFSIGSWIEVCTRDAFDYKFVLLWRLLISVALWMCFVFVTASISSLNVGLRYAWDIEYIR